MQDYTEKSRNNSITNLQLTINKVKEGAASIQCKKKVVIVVESDIQYEELIGPRVWPSRPKRSKMMPKQFNGYEFLNGPLIDWN